MRLPPGRFFGMATHQVALEHAALSARQYEAFDNQPWHTHERPTVFVEVAGDHVDESARNQAVVPCLSITYHPAGWTHRSRFGPRGAWGYNLELTEEWLDQHRINPADLGEARTLIGSEAQCAASMLLRLHFLGMPLEEIENLMLDLVEPLLKSSSEQSPRWMKGLQRQIRMQLGKPLRISDLAHDLGVHPVHLSRVFRKQYGRTLSQHLQILRTCAAISFVLDGESIGRAALDAGFADQFHFARTLRKHFGFRPKDVKQLKCLIRS